MDQTTNGMLAASAILDNLSDAVAWDNLTVLIPSLCESYYLQGRVVEALSILSRAATRVRKSEAQARDLADATLTLQGELQSGRSKTELHLLRSQHTRGMRGWRTSDTRSRRRAERRRLAAVILHGGEYEPSVRRVSNA